MPRPKEYMGAVKQLGEYALEEKLLTEAQLEQALKRQKEVGGYLGDVLVDMWLITEETKLRLLGKQLGVPYISPKDMEHVDSPTARLVPETMSVRYHAIPIKQDESGLTVVMANPFDVVAKDDLRKYTNCEIIPVFGSKKAIEETQTKLLNAYLVNGSEDLLLKQNRSFNSFLSQLLYLFLIPRLARWRQLY